MRLWLASLLFLTPPIAQAETLHCPVGGERFEVNEAGDCTPDPRLTMTFTPASVCYGQQTMPQCPQNFLPLYKGFTTADLALLESFMVSETYDSAVDRSAYYLAYIIEKYIGESDSRLPVELLFQGLVQDPDHSFSDPIYLNDFLFEIQATSRQAPPNQLPVLQAVTSFVLGKAGRIEEAKTMLEQARQHDADIPGFTAYLTAISTCLDDQSSPYCDPRAIFPTD